MVFWWQVFDLWKIFSQITMADWNLMIFCSSFVYQQKKFSGPNNFPISVWGVLWSWESQWSYQLSWQLIRKIDGFPIFGQSYEYEIYIFHSIINDLIRFLAIFYGVFDAWWAISSSSSLETSILKVVFWPPLSLISWYFSRMNWLGREVSNLTRDWPGWYSTRLEGRRRSVAVRWSQH